MAEQNVSATNGKNMESMTKVVDHGVGLMIFRLLPMY